MAIWGSLFHSSCSAWPSSAKMVSGLWYWCTYPCYVQDVFNGGKGSLLAMAFDRCCDAGGEHWQFVHGEHGQCRPQKKPLTHMPNNKGCQYVIPEVLPNDPSLHNMEGGSIGHGDTTPHHNQSTTKSVKKSHYDVDLLFIFIVASPDHACQRNPKWIGSTLKTWHMTSN